MASLATIAAGLLSVAIGTGAAVLVSGAAAGPSERQITVFNKGDTLTIAGAPESEDLEIRGRQKRCCMRIRATTSFAQFSDDCEKRSDHIACDVRKVDHVVADMGGGTDQVFVEDEFHVLTIRGSTGEDLIIGDKGPETIQGGAENDLLDGRGGKDKVNGGDGTDACADRPGDRLRNCEKN